MVTRTVRGKQDSEVLRIDFPGFSGGQSLKQVDWEEWFRVFDERQLTFLHQDKTGKLSRFNKLVAPNQWRLATVQLIFAGFSIL
jgi:hypothetical protein